MTDDEFFQEVRRALIMLIKAFLKRFGVDILNLPK